VIAVEAGAETRGYPIQILMWHEIVNDEIRGTPVAVTFCPLCNTAIVFDRRLGGDVLDFGTTGRLRDSDLVMYDRQTESWWQQFSGGARRRACREGARAAPRADSRVEQLPARPSVGTRARRGDRVRPRIRREPVRQVRQRRLVAARSRVAATPARPASVSTMSRIRSASPLVRGGRLPPGHRDRRPLELRAV
jgi:hypothetical protein